MIVTCGIFLDGAALFPGFWSLWPLFGLALVLIAAPGGVTPGRLEAAQLLSGRFFSSIGDLSYSLYLWHWPILLFYMQVRDRDAVGIRGAAVVFTASLVLSITTYWCVEKPLQRTSSLKPAWALNTVSIAAGIAIATVAAITILPVTTPSTSTAALTLTDLNDETYLGAREPYREVSAPEAEFEPKLEDLADNRATYLSRNCYQKMGNEPETDEIKICDDPNMPENPTARVVIAGGSHAGHLEPTVRAIGQSQGWEVLVVLKDSCRLQHRPDEPDMCEKWNDNFVEWLKSADVDLVIAPGTSIQANYEKEDSTSGGRFERWAMITDIGVDLLLPRGLPRPAELVTDCLAAGKPPIACGADSRAMEDENPLETASLPSRAETIDVLPYVCPHRYESKSTQCSAVVGNVVVWYDASHLTKLYAETLSEPFEHEMRKVYPKYFK